MEIRRIPEAHSARTLLGTLDWLRGGDGRRVRPDVWTAEPMGLDVFRSWIAARLDAKITASDPRTVVGRNTDPDAWWRSWRDARCAQEYRTGRILRPGSGFETRAARMRLPDIQLAMVLMLGE